MRKPFTSCGDDLIQLINDILDLSKIESGYISTDFVKLRFHEITSFVETTFKHISETRICGSALKLDAKLPASMETDVQRSTRSLKTFFQTPLSLLKKEK